MNRVNKIDSLSLKKLAEKIQSGELSCLQVANHYIENIEKKTNLNAFINFDKSSVLKEAKNFDDNRHKVPRGRLYGVPLIIKDNIHVKDIPNTAGCAALKSFVPRQDAVVVERLRREGALFIGKANLDELFINYTGENAYYGNVGNAYNAEYSAGGSSGGVACAIASRQAPAGLGTDTNGSIRVPSSANGVCGLRPTLGRYSNLGMTPLSSSKDTIGPMAKSVNDLIFLDHIITNEDKSNEAADISLKKLKIGVPKGYITTDLDPEVEAAFEQIKTSLSRNDIKLVDVDMKLIGEIANKISMIISTYEAPIMLTNYLSEYNIDLSYDALIESIQTPESKRKFATFMASNAPRAVRKEKYDECINVLRPRLKAELKRVFNENELNVLISPSLACLPVRFDEIKGAETMWKIAKNCIMTCNSGIPSVTVPMGRSKHGLPIGLQLDALWHQDRYLLELTALIQRCWTNDTDFD